VRSSQCAEYCGDRGRSGCTRITGRGRLAGPTGRHRWLGPSRRGVAGVSGLLTTNTLWYIGRGTGVTALLLLSLVMVLGIVTRAGEPVAGLPRFAISTLHRTTSLSALFFLTIHIVMLYLDPFAQLSVAVVTLGFIAPYRPLWQGLGTVAVELVVALVISSLLRTRMSLRSWRLIHWSAYLCWPFAMLHAIGIGTDHTSKWMLAIDAACITSVLAAIGWRIVSSRFTPDTASAKTFGLGVADAPGPR
jgi:sulfoxide reductase heme-binding subunit YedZ